MTRTGVPANSQAPSAARSVRPTPLKVPVSSSKSSTICWVKFSLVSPVWVPQEGANTPVTTPLFSKMSSSVARSWLARSARVCQSPGGALVVDRKVCGVV